MVRVKRFTEKYFSENDLRKNKKKIFFFRKMFYWFEIRKTFYRKIAWFFVDQENIFRWLLIFRKINTRKSEKYFSISHFQWNKRTSNFSRLTNISSILASGYLKEKCNWLFTTLVKYLNFGKEIRFITWQAHGFNTAKEHY